MDNPKRKFTIVAVIFIVITVSIFLNSVIMVSRAFAFNYAEMFPLFMALFIVAVLVVTMIYIIRGGIAMWVYAACSCDGIAIIESMSRKYLNISYRVDGEVYYARVEYDTSKQYEVGRKIPIRFNPDKPSMCRFGDWGDDTKWKNLPKL